MAFFFVCIQDVVSENGSNDRFLRHELLGNTQNIKILNLNEEMLLMNLSIQFYNNVPKFQRIQTIFL